MAVSYSQLCEWLESLPHKGEEPVSYDGDLYCSICGEPWDKYGISHGDMTGREKRTFLAGKGCPCCKKKEKTGEIINLNPHLSSPFFVQREG